MKEKYTLHILMCFLFISNVSDGQVKEGKLTDLGPQVTETVIQGSVFARDTAGRELVYTVVRGEPAHLLAFDLQTNELLTNLPIEKTDGSWDITVSSDGWIYIAGSNGGYCYRHKPGSQTIENLGKVLGTENYIWDLAAGKDGEIFGATYPGCKVFRYHPKDGFSDVGRGPLVEGENYVRGLVYHAKTNKIYAGIGSHAQLVELDPVTGAKSMLLPEKYKDQEFVYNMGLIEGLDGGDRLLLTVQNLKKSLVYNLETHQFEKEIDEFYVKTAIKSPDGQTCYYTSSNKLLSSSLNKPEQPSKEVALSNGNALASKWGKDGLLYLLNPKGELLRYNPKSGQINSIRLKIPPQPIKINFVAAGPDGRIWTGGYLTGTNAAYDPLAKTTTIYQGLSQTESMTTLGSEIYFGIYPHARFYVYDVKRPWNMGKANPKKTGQVAGQDRPFAALAVKELNKVFFGTVPDYGKNGGVLLDFEAGTNKLEVHHNVMPDHSIISLVYSDRLIFGGTSVWGGLGVAPVAAEARIFGWDPLKKIKTFDLVPVPGARAITCLMNGPDGKIWGIAAGTLFIFDSQARKVTARYQLFKDKRTGAIWRADVLLLHPSGKVYGSVNGQLYRIDPATMEIKKLNIAGSYLSMDVKGRFYFAKSLNLWSYEP